MTDTDYTDVLMLLTNTPAQVESLLYSMGLVEGVIGLYMTAHKREFMCLNKKKPFLLKVANPQVCKAVHISKQQYLIFKK